MPKHPTKKERNKSRFVQIERWEYNSDAFKALSPNAFKVYFFMRSIYNGRNNGQIGMGARRAGEILQKSYVTGSRALLELEALGFIKIKLESWFGQKKLVREYELTALAIKPAEKSNKLPLGSKDFMRLKTKKVSQIQTVLKVGKKQNIVPFVKSSVARPKFESKKSAK